LFCFLCEPGNRLNASKESDSATAAAHRERGGLSERTHVSKFNSALFPPFLKKEETYQASEHRGTRRSECVQGESYRKESAGADSKNPALWCFTRSYDPRVRKELNNVILKLTRPRPFERTYQVQNMDFNLHSRLTVAIEERVPEKGEQCWKCSKLGVSTFQGEGRSLFPGVGDFL
jgi:hypothetical protein